MKRPRLARQYTRVRNILVVIQLQMLRRMWKMDIGEGCRISLKARLDKTFPTGIHIGAYTGIGAGCVVLTHDFIRNSNSETRIGSNCHIGVNSIVLPGVTIGDSCIVAPGSVVSRDVPSGSLVSGNPARVFESGLELGHWGLRPPGKI